MRESRLRITRELTDVITQWETPPSVLVSGSAVGYYGARGDDVLDEEEPPGDEFQSELCLAWEQAARRVEGAGIRLCRIRTGIVLGANEGALAQMLPPFRFGLGGHFGSGRQFMPWIHIRDEIRAIRFLMAEPGCSGAYNLTAPEPVSNRQFSATLARVLHRPKIAWVPGPVLRLMLGEMAHLLLTGQRAVPAALEAAGFAFEYRHLQPALADLLTDDPGARPDGGTDSGGARRRGRRRRGADRRRGAALFAGMAGRLPAAGAGGRAACGHGHGGGGGPGLHRRRLRDRGAVRQHRPGRRLRRGRCPPARDSVAGAAVGGAWHRCRQRDPDGRGRGTLADAQRAAADAGLYFPLTLASRERCRIGGNLATNAGGLNVVHYGNTRDLVLGLEVVTADGRVWNNLTGLRKDNSGFDLNDLFVGSEGALGIITAAVFKLHSPIVQQSVALFGLDTPAQAVGVQRRLTAASGHNLTGCELMSRQAVALACAHIEGCAEPFEAACDWYLLVELASSASGDWLAAALDGAIADLRAEGIVRSVRVAADAAGARDLWHLRESLPPAQVAEGASIKHDISLPVSRLPAFLDRALPAVREALPGVRPCPFGHVGDGNLHFNLSKPAGSDDAAFLSETARANAVVHDIVAEMGGSFAAEHGIGRLKVNALARYKQPVERDMLIAIKRALDPDNRLNPGAVVDLDARAKLARWQARTALVPGASPALRCSLDRGAPRSDSRLAAHGVRYPTRGGLPARRL